jgi:hypothetical protein
MKMKLTTGAVMLLMAGILPAAPHDSSTQPLPNEARAIVALNAFSTGPWVQGDWALKCFLLAGHGRERVRVPVDVIGGWRKDIGRWQRMRLPNGRQWLIKDVPMSEVVPADFSGAKGADDPFGAALLPGGDTQSAEATETIPAVKPLTQKQEKKVGQTIQSKDHSEESPQNKISKKPAEGEMILTPMTPTTNKSDESSAAQAGAKRSPQKSVELVFNGSQLVAASPGAEDVGSIGITLEGGISQRGNGSSRVASDEADGSQGEAPLNPSPVIQGSRMMAGVWELGAGGKGRLLSAEERLNTINERLSLSWELYTMNFLNMPTVRYKGVQKVRARWCDTLELTGGDGPYAKALVWIDTEFGAPLEAELYDVKGNLSKTISAVSIQRVRVPTGNNATTENEWILKQWEVLDAATHNKVTIDVAAVSLNRAWDSNLYSEKSPLKEWPEIGAGEWNVVE